MRVQFFYMLNPPSVVARVDKCEVLRLAWMNDVFVLTAVTVRTRQGDVVLQPTDLAVPPSHMLGIMGNVTSGKDALFRAMTGRLHLNEVATGNVHARRPFCLVSVELWQAMPTYLTVYEYLHYANNLRHAAWNVLACVETFGLKDFSHVRLCDLPVVKQRLVCMAARFPEGHHMLVLHEPCRDLNPEEALSLMTCLCTLVNEGLRVVVFFDMMSMRCASCCHDLMYMKHGQAVYVGHDWKNDVLSYLCECDCLHTDVVQSPLEHLREAALTTVDRRRRVTSSWPRAPLSVLVPTRPRASCRRFDVGRLSRRYGRHMWRKRTHLQAQAIYALIMVTLCGALFYKVPETFAVTHIHFIFCMLALQMFLSAGLLPSFHLEECIYEEDRRLGMHAAVHYTLVRLFLDTCVDVVVSILLTALLCVPLKYMDRLHGGTVFLLVWGLAVRLVSTQAMVLVSTVCHRGGQVVVVSGALLLLLSQFLTCGILVNPSSLSWPLRMGHDLSFATYALHSILVRLHGLYPVASKTALVDYAVDVSHYTSEYAPLSYVFGLWGMYVLLNVGYRLRGRWYVAGVVLAAVCAAVLVCVH